MLCASTQKQARVTGRLPTACLRGPFRHQSGKTTGGMAESLLVHLEYERVHLCMCVSVLCVCTCMHVVCVHTGVCVSVGVYLRVCACAQVPVYVCMWCMYACWGTPDALLSASCLTSQGFSLSLGLGCQVIFLSLPNPPPWGCTQLCLAFYVSSGDLQLELRANCPFSLSQLVLSFRKLPAFSCFPKINS